MNINLHIERLVLDGLPIKHHEGPLVKAALEAELSRRLSADGLPDDRLPGGAIPSVRSPGVVPAASDQPRMLGRQIAGAVINTLGDLR